MNTTSTNLADRVKLENEAKAMARRYIDGCVNERKPELIPELFADDYTSRGSQQRGGAESHQAAIIEMLERSPIAMRRLT